MNYKISGAFLFLLLSPFISVEAHTGVDIAHGFEAGLEHPFIGLDHVWVMPVVGIWAALSGGRALWIAPVGFLAFMSLGVGLQWLGVSIIEADSGIMFLIVGLALISPKHWLAFSTISWVIMAITALSHGYAHALEAQSDSWFYVSGLLISSAVLQIIGLGFGWLSIRQLPVIRLAFAVLGTVSGIVMLLGF